MEQKCINSITLSSNYNRLLCYQKAVVVYDLTHHFCSRFIKSSDRTCDQMIQAARSGKQNIVEGYGNLATSKEMGIKLLKVSHGSHMELLEDYYDYLRVRGLRLWDKESREAKAMSQLGKENNDPQHFVSLAESRTDETIANMAIILIKQCMILTQKYIERTIENFTQEGGFREKMTKIRLNIRNGQ